MCTCTQTHNQHTHRVHQSRGLFGQLNPQCPPVPSQAQWAAAEIQHCDSALTYRNQLILQHFFYNTSNLIRFLGSLYKFQIYLLVMFTNFSV